MERQMLQDYRLSPESKLALSLEFTSDAGPLFGKYAPCYTEYEIEPMPDERKT
jgi:hypothetical protein